MRIASQNSKSARIEFRARAIRIIARRARAQVFAPQSKTAVNLITAPLYPIYPIYYNRQCWQRREWVGVGGGGQYIAYKVS